MSFQIVSLVARGTVRIRSNIRCFTRNDVIFDDGTIADNVDHVSSTHFMNYFMFYSLYQIEERIFIYTVN